MGGGAVVLFEADDFRALEVFLEAQDIADLGPAPAIDGLVVVADAADVAVPPGEQPQPHVLGDVRILIFVDKDVFEPCAVFGQNVVMGLKDADDMQQQVAEIDGVQGQQAILIFAVERHPLAVEGLRLMRGHLVGGPGAVFPMVDNARQHPGRPFLLVDPGGDDELFEQALLIVGVEDCEVGFQVQVAHLAVHRDLAPDQFGVMAQQLDADRMEGAKPRHAFGHLPHHATDPFAHFARGLVGKGHGEDFARTRPPRCHKMRNSRGQGAGLARARPR